jgi:ribosomal protein S18 acetylase RimI-like enzyme
MGLEIRRVKERDRSDLLRLWHLGWHDAHAGIVPGDVLKFRTPEHFSIWLSQSTERFYVACDRSLLGFVSIEGTEIVKLYVAGEARGTDVARSLLRHAEKILGDEGVTIARLFCTAGNLRAQRFYAREGWRLVETFEDNLWVPPDVAMQYPVLTHRYEKSLPEKARDGGKD